MELKTKEMNQILQILQKKTNELLLTNAFIDPSEVLIVKSVFSEQLSFLTQKFKNLKNDDNCDYEETDIKFADMGPNSKHNLLLKDIDEYIKQIGNYNTVDHSAKHMTELLLSKFKLALRTLEDLECLPLKQQLQDCLDYIKEMGAANEIEDLRNIKEFGTSILVTLEPLQKYRKSLVSASLLEKLALYISQLCTSFGMLVQLAQEQHSLNAPIYACKKYICERICTCCGMMLELLNGSNPTLEEEAYERENHFVYRMDLALDIILEMPSTTHQEQLSDCTELWLRLEDVFSHAMAITQVCQPYNFKAITGSCQSIVLEYEKLKQQLQSEIPDPALNTLFMHTLTDALYRLEHKVNVAVLTLVMEVFSNPYAALKKLVMTCGSSLNAKERSKNDLNNLIEDFDQLFDQIMQIGIFAIACCKDMNRNNKIRNCLAGFESLETELISAIVSFYLHSDNKEMRSSVKLLTAQWQSEMSKFQNVVNLIINSAAFCQVILDDLQERIIAISDCLDNRQPVTQHQVQDIVQRASALSNQVTAVVNDIGIENFNRHTIMMTRELKAAIFEANTASKTLLIKNAPEPQQLRVIKRCELILNVIQRLQPALSKIMNDTMHKKSEEGQENSSYGILSDNINFPPTVYSLPRDKSSLVYIKTPYTVKSCKPPLSIQPANSIVRKPSDLSCLLPYIKIGRILRNEHSIMYHTPCKVQDATESVTNREITFRNLSSIRQHLFGRDFTFHNTNIDISEESMDLTAVLEKINLSISANAELCRSLTVQNVYPATTDKKLISAIDKKLISAIDKKLISAIDKKLISDTESENFPETTSETQTCLSKSAMTGKLNEYSGGGDASLVMEVSRKLSSVQFPSNRPKK